MIHDCLIGKHKRSRLNLERTGDHRGHVRFMPTEYSRQSARSFVVDVCGRAELEKRRRDAEGVVREHGDVVQRRMAEKYRRCRHGCRWRQRGRSVVAVVVVITASIVVVRR